MVIGSKLVRSYPTEPEVARNGMNADGWSFLSLMLSLVDPVDRVAWVKSNTSGCSLAFAVGVMLQVKLSLEFRVTVKAG